MAYITLGPSNKQLERHLAKLYERIVSALEVRLQELGVPRNDIIVRILEARAVRSNRKHVEVILKTDNEGLTASGVKLTLNAILDVPFEVSRILVKEFSGDWASNYREDKDV